METPGSPESGPRVLAPEHHQPQDRQNEADQRMSPSDKLSKRRRAERRASLRADGQLSIAEPVTEGALSVEEEARAC